MKKFWDFSKRYMLRYWLWFAVGFGLVLVTRLLAVGIIEQTKNGIDAVVTDDATASTILPFVKWIILSAIGLAITRIVSRLLCFTPARLAEYHIRNDYFAQLLYLQRDFFRRHESGDLVSRCSNDIGFIRAAYGFGVLQIAEVTITLTLGLGAMFRMDVKTTLLLSAPMVVALILIQLNIAYLFRYWRLANEQLGKLSSLCLASFKGVAALQNYHAEPAVEARFGSQNEAYCDTQVKIAKVRSFFMPLIVLVEFISVFFILVVVGPKVIDGVMSIGEIMAFLGYTAMVMPPLRAMGWMLNVFNRAVPAMERLDEIILAEPKLLPASDEQVKGIGGGVDVHIRQMSFSFPETKNDPEPFAIRDINLDLPAGRVIGVVGPLGSGKTTFIETLLRLNWLEEGMVEIDGKDAARLELSHYRDLMTFAPQKALLFSASLRKNLMMALPTESWDKPNVEEKLLEILQVAGFQLNPQQFPDGLETEVGQKGVMLSGGQRQRIALARALLKQASIYILDDVLSAVDHETEKRIVANLRTFAAGKTLIIASHRVSAVQWADEILVFGEGRIVDRGSHEELCSRPGFYRDIHQHQSQDMEGNS